MPDSHAMLEQSNNGGLYHPDSSDRWLILAVLTVTQIGASVAALSFGPLAPFLQETLNITRAQVGLCTSSLYLGCILVAGGDVTVAFESGASGTALTGDMSLAADGNGFVLPMSEPGKHWFETAAATLLNLELDGAVQVSGVIVYYTEA